MSESNTTDDGPHGKHAGRLDVTYEHVVSGRWLTDIDLVIFAEDGSIDPRIVDGELTARVQVGEPDVVTQAAINAGLFEHDVWGRDPETGFRHRYTVGGEDYTTLTYRYEPQASRYGSIDFYVDSSHEV